MLVRIGNGFDAHRLVEGRPLIIGGVRIPWHMGLEGHSDADVLIHAICDALLGAAALGDIGYHFPSSDDTWRSTDSRQFLTYTVQLLSENGWGAINLDATIVAQKPQMAPYIDRMRDLISKDMGIDINAVSIKATTTEGLGFSGRQEGIAVLASALISDNKI